MTISDMVFLARNSGQPSTSDIGYQEVIFKAHEKKKKKRGKRKKKKKPKETKEIIQLVWSAASV
jgi:hypothetical protein